MRLIFASKNRNKAREVNAILGDGYEIVTQTDAGYGDIDVVEDGATFEENAVKKATAVMNASGQPCIADDSGLCVDALGGRPGVYTARFAGENATDEENIKKLLSELDGVPFEKRTARFVCTVAVAIPGKEPTVFRGECEGVILDEKRGENGFGYDPVFYVEKYQKTMAQLYDVSVKTINYHIKKIFDDSELSEDSVIRKFRITATDGKSYSTNHYALQMIIAVGFKVNSERAVQFRKWVNQIATQYTIRGWVMDDERLKQGTYLTDKYFEEQLERIREIRASERKFYQKITDLYATAIDYDRTSAATKRFYATVQNKMHFAVHGHTAAELIMERADHTKDHMGLTTWQDAPDGKIKKSDVSIAKNYLTEDELGQLNRMVTSYLDFAENMAQRHIPLTMQDWETRLNRFIEMFEYGLLRDAGRVSAEIARLHAETEFEKYRVIQDREFLSDYDRFLLELEEHADATKPDHREEKP